MSYTIIKKTKDYIVINKHAGILVHGAKHLQEKTLADELKEKFPEIEKVGDDPWRPGIVHRLDKLVSGAMVVARNQETFNHLKEQFQKRKVKKIYTALVYGKMSSDYGEIDFPIARSKKGFKMSAQPRTVKGERNDDARRAETLYDVKKHLINYTLLKVKIKTGRTHQIRVHLSALGHPVVGDDLYGTKKTRIKNKKIDLGRIWLHASLLEFKDLEGATCSFESELPEKLNEFLKIAK